MRVRNLTRCRTPVAAWLYGSPGEIDGQIARPDGDAQNRDSRPASPRVSHRRFRRLRRINVTDRPADRPKRETTWANQCSPPATVPSRNFRPISKWPFGASSPDMLATCLINCASRPIRPSKTAHGNVAYMRIDRDRWHNFSREMQLGQLLAADRRPANVETGSDVRYSFRRRRAHSRSVASAGQTG